MPENWGNATTEHRRSRPRTVLALSLFLLLQSIAYVALCLYLRLPDDWRGTAEYLIGGMPPQQIDDLSIILIPGSILAVLSAIGFLLLLPTGWLLAMAIQGATLLGCLTLYLDTKPVAIFPVMLYCIVMAFSLNSFNVRAAFYGGTADRER